MHLSAHFVKFFCRVIRKDARGKPMISLNVLFLVKLCGDVLLEVLRFGNRRRLTVLECVGRRMFFQIKPFHRLNLTFKPAGFYK